MRLMTHRTIALTTELHYNNKCKNVSYFILICLITPQIKNFHHNLYFRIFERFRKLAPNIIPTDMKSGNECKTLKIPASIVKRMPELMVSFSLSFIR